MKIQKKNFFFFGGGGGGGGGGGVGFGGQGGCELRCKVGGVGVRSGVGVGEVGVARFGVGG